MGICQIQGVILNFPLSFSISVNLIFFFSIQSPMYPALEGVRDFGHRCFIFFSGALSGGDHRAGRTGYMEG